MIMKFTRWHGTPGRMSQRTASDCGPQMVRSHFPSTHACATTMLRCRQRCIAPVDENSDLVDAPRHQVVNIPEGFKDDMLNRNGIRKSTNK